MKDNPPAQSSEYMPICSIKGCKIWAESIKRFGMEFCYNHQLTIDKWLVERGYTNGQR